LEPTVVFLLEAFAQGIERLGRPVGSDGQGRFGRGVIASREEAGEPGDCSGALNAEDAEIAGAQDFRFVARQDRARAAPVPQRETPPGQ